MQAERCDKPVVRFLRCREDDHEGLADIRAFGAVGVFQH